MTRTLSARPVFVAMAVTVLAIGAVVIGALASHVTGSLWLAAAVAMAVPGATGVAVWLLNRHMNRGAPGHRSPRQHVVVCVDADAVKALDAATAALQVVAGVPVAAAAGSVDHLEARTRRSMRSWGELLTIDVAAGQENTRLVIRSSPLVSSQLVDYGKAQENISRIRDELARHGIILCQ